MLAALHRRHLCAKRRDQRQEVRLHSGPMPGAASAALAHQLTGKHTSPGQAAVRAERKMIVQQACNSMDPLDRPRPTPFRGSHQPRDGQGARAEGIGGKQEVCEGSREAPESALQLFQGHWRSATVTDGQHTNAGRGGRVDLQPIVDPRQSRARFSASCRRQGLPTIRGVLLSFVLGGGPSPRPSQDQFAD